MLEELEGPGQYLGYRAMQRKLREQHKLAVPRTLVYDVMSLVSICVVEVCLLNNCTSPSGSTGVFHAQPPPPHLPVIQRHNKPKNFSYKKLKFLRLTCFYTSLYCKGNSTCSFCYAPVIWNPRTPPFGLERGIHFLCEWKWVKSSVPGGKSEWCIPHPYFSTHGTPFVKQLIVAKRNTLDKKTLLAAMK